MQIKFFVDGECPEIGSFKRGEIKEISDEIAERFLERKIAEKIKLEKGKTKIKSDNNLSYKKMEVKENGRK